MNQQPQIQELLAQTGRVTSEAFDDSVIGMGTLVDVVRIVTSVVIGVDYVVVFDQSEKTLSFFNLSQSWTKIPCYRSVRFNQCYAMSVKSVLNGFKISHNNMNTCFLERSCEIIEVSDQRPPNQIQRDIYSFVLGKLKRLDLGKLLPPTRNLHKRGFAASRSHYRSISKQTTRLNGALLSFSDRRLEQTATFSISTNSE
nr:hypothetical protein [Tanacetum cinerariifolium]